MGFRLFPDAMTEQNEMQMVFVRRSAFLDDVEVTYGAIVFVMEDARCDFIHPVDESLLYG